MPPCLDVIDTLGVRPLSSGPLKCDFNEGVRNDSCWAISPILRTLSGDTGVPLGEVLYPDYIHQHVNTTFIFENNEKIKTLKDPHIFHTLLFPGMK